MQNELISAKDNQKGEFDLDEAVIIFYNTLNNKLKLSEFYQVKWDGVSKREKTTYYNERCFLITFNLSRYALYASEGVCS